MTHARKSRLSWRSLSVPVVACALPGFTLGGAAGKIEVNG